MREILFRGKRLDNGEWTYGYYCPKPYSHFPCEATIFPSETIDRDWHGERVDSDTVGQFTGLTDRNGVKIFEGDIVEFSHPYSGKSTHAVVQDGCRWNLSNFYASCFDCPGCAFSEGTEYMTVIGNIYDNPELLEVSGNEM